MKTFFKLSLLVLVVSLYSCSNDEINETNAIEKENNLQLNKGVPLLPPQANFLSPRNKAQWVAFLTAQAILNDAAAHDAFVNNMGVPGKSNSFQILLNQNAFKEAFLNEFEFYYNEDSNAGCDYGLVVRRPEPEGKPVPEKADDGDLLYDTLPPDERYDITVTGKDYYFYLPNGYNSNTNTIKTSAYIDISVDNNEGYSHVSRCDVDNISVSPSTHGNVLIVHN